MDNPFRVCGIQCIGNLNAELQDLLDRQWLALNSVLERLPLQALHADKGPTFVLTNVVNRADVGVVQG